MKAFISYSTKEKQFGAAVKAIFDKIGIESFLAHNDLHVSEEWKTRILSELKSCNIFVPLLSKSFKESDWCNQEIGVIANRRGVLVIPISLDGLTPYGFISQIQGHFVRDDKIDRGIFYTAIGKKWPEIIVDVLLRSMEHVHEFRTAEAVVEPLTHYFRHFNEVQANKFAELAVNNGQIWNASLCQEKFLPEFLKINKDKIKRTLYRALKFQIENRTWYALKKRSKKKIEAT